MIHYSLRDKAVVALGQQETMRIMDEVWERLRATSGDTLGGPVT